jgi:chemotaxis protein methyltransferase CheR
MVELRRHNLVTDEPLRAAEPGWHAILCRNVFIYFRRQRMAEICRRLTSALSPDGWLAVAASETLRGLDAPLAPEVIQGRVFYRKTAVRETPPAPAPPGPEPAAKRPGPSVIDAAADLARQGDLDAAIELILGAHADGQWPLAYHLAHGHLQLRRHRIPDALRAYRCAADIDALQCEVHYFEGVAHRKAGDWRAAAAAFRRAIFLAPGFWQAAYLLAGAHERLGNAREAERDRTHAANLLREARPGVVFLSHPVFVNWFSIPEEEARRNLGIPR